MTTIDQVKSQAQEQAGALAGRAKGLIIGEIDRRSSDFGHSVQPHVESIRNIGNSLRAQGQASSAQFADAAADRLEQLGYYLSETDGERIVADVENVARRQPLLTVCAGLALGMVAARLLKAGASQRYREYCDSPSTRLNQNRYQAGSALSYYED